MRAPESRNKSALGRVGLIAVLVLTGLVAALAEQLPIKTYTTADGLARDQINRIVQDSHGFLWFCTAEGLSRFDGYKFTNYTTDQGLPSRSINDFLETRSGEYWVATGNGVSRFKPVAPTQAKSRSGDRQAPAGSAAPDSEDMFITHRPRENGKPNSVNVLLEDSVHTIWCGTNGGLYRMEESNGQTNFRFVDLGMPNEFLDDTVVTAIVEDRKGALWVGAGSGLYALRPDGRVTHYSTQHGLPANAISTLLEDREAKMWVGTKSGLCEVIADPAASRQIVRRVYTMKDGLPGSNHVESLFQASDGRLWVGTFGGLSELTPQINHQSQSFRSYTTAQGLSGFAVTALAEDRDGNLWIAGDGAMKLARSGFTSYTEADGLSRRPIVSIFENPMGELCFISSAVSNKFLHGFDGKKFTTIRPNVPRSITYFGWGWNQITFQDHTGEWWVATGHGLYRFPKVSRTEPLAHARPKAVYSSRNGLGEDIFRLFEDSRGDIWIVDSSEIATAHRLARWERATETFHNYADVDGLPPGILATAFCEDASGNLWIGTNGGGIVRYAGGRFTHFSPSDGAPAGWIRAFYLDHAGRLWMAASRGGLSRIDETKADHPRFVNYTTLDGLSSNDLWGVTEDRWNRIYIGTGRGVDRLDTATGYIKHFTTADGLAKGVIHGASRRPETMKREGDLVR